MSRSFVTGSAEETRRIGTLLAERLAPDGLLLLFGEMGSGKTVLAQGIGEALGVPAEEVQSPTFTLVNEHQGTEGRLVHIDLYRLAPEEAAAIGLEETLAQPGIKVVEWAERLPFAVADAVRVRLERLPGGEHRLEVEEPSCQETSC